jgi:plasmid stabilization system protein ParE
MKPIEIRAEAELDIIEAALWYENEREGFGAEFSFEVERSVARIAENPLMFQEREMGMRMAKVGRFPYGLYFVDEFDGGDGQRSGGGQRPSVRRYGLATGDHGMSARLRLRNLWRCRETGTASSEKLQRLAALLSNP